jgi:hypothetical protein
MIIAVLLFQTAAAAAQPASAPTATPAPVTSAPRTLADVGRERRLAKEKGEAKPGSFSAAESSAPSSEPAGSDHSLPSPSAAQAKEAKAAQARMDKAARDGVRTNRRRSAALQDDARAEWDAAADHCRKTPGCNPAYRENARDAEGKKLLRTRKEKIKDIAKEGQVSE